MDQSSEERTPSKQAPPERREESSPGQGDAEVHAPSTPRQKPAATPKKKKERELIQKVRARSDFVYTWPLVVLGFAYPLVVRIAGVNSAAWIYLATLAMVFVCGFADWNRFVSLIMALLAGLSWVCIAYMNSQGATLFVKISEFFTGLAMTNLEIPAGIFALFLLACISATEFESWLNRRWMFRPNVISRIEVSGGETPIAQGQNVPEFLFPDLWEAILGFGAGTIIVTGADGKKHNIENVLFLWFRKQKIRRICHTQQVVVRKEI